MMRKLLSLIVLAVVFAIPSYADGPVKLQSPDGQLELKFEVIDGMPQYSLDRVGTPVVLPS